MATWATTMASAALTPFSGAAEAWASRPGVVHLDVVDGQAGGLEPVLGPGVDHHRGVGAVERAALEQEDLAPAALLGRRAEHRDRQPDVVGHRGQGHARADGGGGDEVVAAGVAHAGQRVVLGADHDGQGARTGPSRAARWAGRRRRARPRSRPRRARRPPGAAARVLLEAELGLGRGWPG